VKRAISAVLVLLTLGVAALFFLRVRPYLPERPRGAELAPPETIFFAQIPNLRETALRVPDTELYQIWREPEVQAFFEKPRRKAPWMREWEENFEEMVRVAPGEVFVAITSIKAGKPGFVGGFAFAGRASAAEALATRLRKQLFPGLEMVSSIRANWYLFASDGASLGKLLERFDGKPEPALAADPVFQQSIEPLGVGQDLVFYGKPESLAGRLDALTGLAGANRPKGEEAVAMATKIEGSKLRDTIFLRGVGAHHAGAVSRHTLALAPPETLLYYATDLAPLPTNPESGGLHDFLPGFARMERALAEKGLGWKELPSAIGPEWGAMVEWPEDAALPTVLLGWEVRDHAKAGLFLEALTAPSTLGGPWRKEDQAGVTVSSAPPQALSFERPTAALTERFALLGFSPEVVSAALPRTKSKMPSLAQTESFQKNARVVPEWGAAFGYHDFPRLFERLYRMARPFITLSLAFSPESGAQFDAGKLPPVNAISKHLNATVLTQTHVKGGMVIESTGSLTFPELVMSVGLGGMASGLPDLPGLGLGGLKGVAPSKTRKSSDSAADPAASAANPPDPSDASEKNVVEHK
jgi:hypothetical protein